MHHKVEKFYSSGTNTTCFLMENPECVILMRGSKQEMKRSDGSFSGNQMRVRRKTNPRSSTVD